MLRNRPDHAQGERSSAGTNRRRRAMRRGYIPQISHSPMLEFGTLGRADRKSVTECL